MSGGVLYYELVMTLTYPWRSTGKARARFLCCCRVYVYCIQFTSVIWYIPRQDMYAMYSITYYNLFYFTIHYAIHYTIHYTIIYTIHYTIPYHTLLYYSLLLLYHISVILYYTVQGCPLDVGARVGNWLWRRRAPLVYTIL